ncbi:RHS repeat-associated core domain-containing protein, partial [Stenotrophomonas maltophilia]|nr:RHS repeat-associated core domain-containing protein [Stenotrophomonas maltophilia]
IWLDNYPVALINTPATGVPELAYVQPDHLGTPRVVIDPVRNVSIWEWSNKSEVFGNQIPSADPDGDGVAFELALRFPGQQATDASGLFYNHHREYDPAVGRYSQSDPIGLRGGISTYGYVGGNSLSLIDPLGLRNVHKTAVAIGNAINAGRLLASGTLRIAGGLGMEGAVVTAAPGSASIGLGVWNITSGQKAWARAEQQWAEAACEDSSNYSRGDVLKTYSGLLPWGTESDDPGEPFWIDIMEKHVKEAVHKPREFLQEVGTIGL